MKATWFHRSIWRKHGVHMLTIEADEGNGGPYIDREEDGSTTLSWYGKPGGKVSVNLTSKEMNNLEEELRRN